MKAMRWLVLMVFAVMMVATGHAQTSVPAVENLLSDDLGLVKQIREQIAAKTNTTEEEEEMVDYRGTIPRLDDEPYDMVAIPGGDFLMGSPLGEPGREDDEGPLRRVEVAPFWMGKYEITWNQFEDFMITDVPRDKAGNSKNIAIDAALVDIISAPTSPYVEMSFGMGKDGFPAICMTQHAASKFCQWLSAQTGHYYRLPTEAEWEYACRAGTTTAYSFGDDPARLSEYGWFWNGKADDAAGQYQKVGKLKPNPWGLHDMHGNVFEWCLDQYFGDCYNEEHQAIPAKKLYPRVVRGGSWYDDAKWLRSASRLKSSADWQSQDADLPKSQWYLTDAQWLGFRIVRPLKVPDAETMHALWNSGAAPDRGADEAKARRLKNTPPARQ